jgi:hypothetical protein
MPNLLTSFWASLGYLGVTLVGATGLAYWLFKTFGEKWLTQKFNERLESYKHEQQKALEKLRLQISSTLDRTTKLHQLEFETLGKLWTLAAAAFGEVHRFTHPLQTTPDLDKMNEVELSEFLAKSSLADWQKEELKEGNDKADRYAKMSFWTEANRVNKVYYDFNNYLIGNGIFIPMELKTKFMDLKNMTHEAMFERTFEEEHPNYRPDRFEKGRQLREEGSKLMEELEGLVHSRLRYSPLDADGPR